MEALVSLERYSEPIRVCIDSRCTSSLVDRFLLDAFMPEILVQRLKDLEWVKGVGDHLVLANEFISITFYLLGKR